MANTYLPTADLTPVWTFVQKTGTSAALQTALTTQYPDVTSIQCFDDANKSGNSLVVVNSGEWEASVPASGYVGYNQGTWSMYTATAFAAKFTAYGS